MASPFDILGGLGLIGSQGLTGAYAGEIQGEKLRRDFQSQDLENQMRQLEMAIRQQRANQPIGFAPGTMVFGPDGRMMQVPFAPRPHLNLGPGHSAYSETGQLIASVPPAPQASVNLGPGHQLRSATGGLLAENPPAPVRHDTESQLWASIGDKVSRGVATPVETEMWKAHLERQARQGAATSDRPFVVGRNLVSREGKVLYTAPPSQAGAVPRETVTTGVKITPRKLLTDMETASIQATMPQIINEVSMKPGFNVPGAYVTLPNGMKVRKEEILSQYILDRLGIETKLAWDGSTFRIIKAWNPASREKTEQTRRTGPPSSRSQDTDDEEE